MVRVGIVGLGKMGISHQAILGANPGVEVVGVCDSNGYLLGVLHKYTGTPVYNRLETMLDEAHLDALVIATPSRLHASMVETAIDRGVHIFCEKPFCLSSADSRRLADAAAKKRLVTQVGYHNRFVGAFGEVKRLLDRKVIGNVSHVLAEAYGPVVLRQSGGTWRSKKDEGGGCLYDYAAHPINLVNWYLGAPQGVGGTVLNRVFSAEIDDEVSSTLYFDAGTTAQVSVNWSDESVRKMTTRLTLWGTRGRIFADRQECQVYLRDPAEHQNHLPDPYRPGWNVKYTTELTQPVGFYLRGEEYSAELDYFIERCVSGANDGENSFSSAAVTDRTLEAMIADARGAAITPYDPAGSIDPAVGQDQMPNGQTSRRPAERQNLISQLTRRLIHR